jgi:hypothetical protein
MQLKQGSHFPQRNASGKDLIPRYRYSNSYLESETRGPHEDLLSSRQENQMQTTAERLRTLATELGECCTAADLAALISQKRDMEYEQVLARTYFKARLRDKIGEGWGESSGTSLQNSDKSTMVRLWLNLLAHVYSEESADGIGQMRSPVNAILSYLSTAKYRDVQKRRYLKVRPVSDINRSLNRANLTTSTASAPSCSKTWNPTPTAPKPAKTSC